MTTELKPPIDPTAPPIEIPKPIVEVIAEAAPDLGPPEAKKSSLKKWLIPSAVALLALTWLYFKGSKIQKETRKREKLKNQISPGPDATPEESPFAGNRLASIEFPDRTRHPHRLA